MASYVMMLEIRDKPSRRL